MRAWPNMERDALARLQQELSGETLLWAGQPSPRVSFRAGLLVWLFAIPWTAFSLGWEGMALSAFFAENTREGGVPLLGYVFPLFGLPFVGVGLWMLSLPFRAARRAHLTVHALTGARFVTAVLGRDTLSVESLDPASVRALRKRERADGSGDLTLTFAPQPVLVPSGIHNGTPVMSEAETSLTLYGVPEVSVLEKALLGLKA